MSTEKTPPKAGLATVFLTVLIDLIGFGIVLPNLAFFASEYGASAFLVGLLYSSYSVAQLFFSPLWGALSDRIGRRPVMIVSTLGSALSYILLGFSNSVVMLFVARLLAGVMAGNISTAQAYVSDVTTPENRARGMGMIGAAFGIGFVLGPAIGAVLAHVPAPNPFFETHPHAMLGFFASALSFLSFFLVITVLPESLNRDARAAADSARPVKMSVFSPSFWKLVSDRESGRGLPLLFFCMFMATFGQASIYGAFPLFCSQVLKLSPGQVGMQYVFVGVVAVLVQGVLIRPLVKKFGLALIAFAWNAHSLFIFIGVMALGWSLNLPTLTSLISKRSDPRYYGATLGASQALAALGRAVGPGWGGLLFGLHYRLPFVLTALIVSSTVFAALRFSDV
jgi:DHA1 family tetracycline resistance protein-like MFS transporter